MLKEIFLSEAGQLRVVWRLVLFSLLIGASYVAWLLFLYFIVGNKVYSFLQTLATAASLLIPTVVVTFLVVRFVERRSWSSLGLRFNRRGFLAFTSGFLLGVGIISILYFSRGLHIWGLNSEFALGAFLVYGLVLLGAAAVEEIIFRGYILQTLESSLRNWQAVLISSILFGIAHLGNSGITLPSFFARPPPLVVLIDSSMIGILLGIAYLRSGTLWLPIGLHFALNFTTANILSAPLRQEFRNGGFLTIDPTAQLLNPQWPLNAFSPSITDMAVEVIIYLAALLPLLLWQFKPTIASAAPPPQDVTK